VQRFNRQRGNLVGVSVAGRYVTPMPSIRDAEACNPERLAALIEARDAEALDRITRCYGDRLMRAALLHCRCEVEAEDAVQDTLIIASERSAQFRREGSLEGWLVRIVASACGRLARGLKNDVGRHDSSGEPHSEDDSPELQASRKEVAARLEQVLLSLSSEDRQLVLLAEVEGYTGEEISAHTGLSHGAVRTRLSRARARLREALGPLSEGESLGA
jgi:RNA polymerase sigma-70 factor (ECF subfamily)